MKTTLLAISLFLTASPIFAQSRQLLFETNYGNFTAVLYDYTPAHRDLILQAVKDDVYKDALFNRIIAGFVVQGGEHDIDIEKREAADLQQRKPRLAAEFDHRAFHQVGALGAGRDGNPEKASFLNQIYFVVGDKVTAATLDSLEQVKGIKYTTEQRDAYLHKGGQPRLDHDYTVFGEVTEGLDVLFQISQLPTDSLDYPKNKVVFNITVL